MSKADVKSPKAAVKSYVDLVHGKVVPAVSGKESTVDKGEAQHVGPESDEHKSHASTTQSAQSSSTPPAPPRRMKRYLRPVFCSMLPQYSLTEQDLIKSAFVPASHVAIKRLPHRLRPDAVVNSRTRHITKNLSHQSPFVTTRRTMKPLGLFGSFDYTPSSFDRLDEVRKHERHERNQRFQILCRNRFQAGAFSRKLKYEELTGSGQYPYVSEAYGFADMLRRRDVMRERLKIRYGPFRPCGKQVAEVDAYRAEALSRKSIIDIVKALHRQLIQDWKDQDFSVAATVDDFICMVFEESSLDSPQALHGYMEVLTQGYLARKYELTPVRELWGRERKPGQVWYLLRPAWINPHTRCSTLEKEEM